MAIGLCLLAAACSNDGEGDVGASLNLDIVPGFALGASHSCVLLASGNVYCWGSNNTGQLGLPGVEGSGTSEPVGASSKVDVGAQVAQLSAGLGHTCALLRDGSVVCWGRGEHGELGTGSSEPTSVSPSQLPRVPLGAAAIQLRAGWTHNCALLVGGAVRCWGEGRGGRLGNGRTDIVGDDEPASASAAVQLGEPAEFIAVGGDASCAAGKSGLRCWGMPVAAGQEMVVGDDEPVNSVPALSLPFSAKGGAVGQDHTCVWAGDQLSCWGKNDAGKLGAGDIKDRKPGELVISTSENVVSVALGRQTTCVLFAGEVRCVGAGGASVLGQGKGDSLGDDEPLADIPALELGGDVRALGSGLFHACALLSSGGVRCWGFGGDGQLGNGSTEVIGDDETPTSVPETRFE